MRTFGTFLLVGILALAAGCGGSSGVGDGGIPQGGMGGGGGMGGNGGAGGGGSSGSCNAPSCISSLLTSCQTSGTCVEQTDTTTFATNQCYSNGVKVLSSFDLTSGAATVTYKNGSTTCYSISVAGLTGTATLTVKNASGQTIATGTTDVNTNATTITCTGGQAVTLNAACDAVTGGSSTTTCTTGTCTP